MRSLTVSSVALAAILACRGAFAADAEVAPSTDPEPSAKPALEVKVLQSVSVAPFVTLVGGLKVDTVIQDPGGAGRAPETREARISAISLADFGLRGTAGPYVSFESELMANGGVSLHGASAFEGQAALQVRRQIIRLKSGPWMGEVGRVVDEASLNFVSEHVLDTLLQDTATRDALLYSGFNMGNGIRGTVEPIKGLRLGLAFTAGNPVATTASLQVGGSFPPSDRVYTRPYQYVKQSPNNFPDDSFHMMLFSPSLLFTNELLDLKASFQGFVVDTNTDRTDDQPIHGFNVRGNARFKFAQELVVPFVNVAVGRNDTVNPTNTNVLAADKYTSITTGGGVDINYAHPYSARANGVGLQYDHVQYQVGSGSVTNLHYLNIGTTYWITEHVAAGARFAMWLRNDVNVHDEGERSVLATLRLVF